MKSLPKLLHTQHLQVPTSSQRDQDEEVDDDGVVVVDCDEGEGGSSHQAQEEEFENDPYEEMEEGEEVTYDEVEVESDTNEVEIVMEDDSAGAEVPRQIQPSVASNQQQSEAISSAGTAGDPPLSFARSSRGIAPMPRQHLLLVMELIGFF